MKRSASRSLKPAAGLAGYRELLGEIKNRIRSAQIRAAFASNFEMLRLYWEVGGILTERQKLAGWGAGALRRLAADLHNDLSDVRGFSERNLKLMTQFYREYPEFIQIGQPVVAQLLPGAPGGLLPASKPGAGAGIQIGQPPVAQLPWAHNIILIQKVKDISTRAWYGRQALEHGWSRNVLSLMIDSRAHERQGGAVTNFSRALPASQSDLAAQAIKDPYIFDFLSIDRPFREREFEAGLLRHLQEFLVELGSGFAFVGRQLRLEVGGDDFYIDLLFYHLHLRCFVVIDLKTGPFKAEYAGKMNLYLSAVDDRMRREGDHPGIGLILCQDKNRVVAEYALRGLGKAIGISEYRLTRSLPKQLKSSLPTIQQLETELSAPAKPQAGAEKALSEGGSSEPPPKAGGGKSRRTAGKGRQRKRR